MEQPATWEMILVAAVVVLVLLWLLPGAKARLQNSRKATAEDWRSLLIPLGLVVAFVMLLIWATAG